MAFYTCKIPVAPSHTEAMLIFCFFPSTSKCFHNFCLNVYNGLSWALKKGQKLLSTFNATKKPQQMTLNCICSSVICPHWLLQQSPAERLRVEHRRTSNDLAAEATTARGEAADAQVLRHLHNGNRTYVQQGRTKRCAFFLEMSQTDQTSSNTVFCDPKCPLWHRSWGLIISCCCCLSARA